VGPVRKWLWVRLPGPGRSEVTDIAPAGVDAPAMEVPLPAESAPELSVASAGPEPATQAPAGPSINLVTLPLQYLYNGAVLGSDLVTEQGIKLLAQGHQVTVEDLTRIRAFSRATRVSDTVQVMRSPQPAR
jgi:hypothetical protein